MAGRTPLTTAGKALKLLGLRPHSEAELRRKLLRSGHPADEVDDVIRDCLRKGYLNDELLAEDSARLLNSRGCGSRLIRKKLRERGIATEDVAAAVELNAENEESAARQALEFKLRMLKAEKDPRKKKEKAFRFLAGRGFSPALAAKLLRETVNTANDGNEEWEHD